MNTVRLGPAGALLLACAAAGEPSDTKGDMAWVAPGELAMGSRSGEASEAPVHRVRLPGFWIDRHEVTNAQFAAFVATTGHVTDAERSGKGWHWRGRWREVAGADWRHPHGPDTSIAGLERHPVVQVSWHDAVAYCRWRGRRLPTEAEWERAARGRGGRTYAWGDDPPREGDLYRASYGADACCRADDGDGYRHTAPVASFPAGESPFGVQDMTGNVWEWVADGFEADYYARSPVVDPRNASPSVPKVIRGGGWGNDPYGLRATLRHANPPAYALSMVGIRCAAGGGRATGGDLSFEQSPGPRTSRMPVYEYHCEANGRTVEVTHPMDVSLGIWGEVCYVAQIPLGDTDPTAPVRRVLTSAPAAVVSVGNATLKEKGFTKLVKRDEGVYENVTATADEERYMKAGDPASMPHLHKKVED